ncbi:REX4-like, 3'-5' exonuclease, transcript variant X1 [Ictidomys tridecemlineatus]|uniref:RNA exonuclease 4 isoform X1 n=2 Tax=Ictidomys tridecemlineatus TaxID=43179 RepID=UPI000B53DA4A|nr:RNA exonuclease 4 isoform X1 [Ictidomys tridecemlineatus]KAG3288275.1 REX4-like, 3'-5' exonuclease, transcript variant X1 [Ictidomys tridecemlineatus]
MKAKALASERAASILAAQPGAVGKLARKRSKKRFWKSKAREGSSTPGSVPRVAVGRPPKAPEDFSQNWKALRELLKQTSQTPEKPVVSQMDPKKQPHLNQQNRKETSAKVKGEEMPTKKDQEATRGSVPSGSRRERIVPVPPTEAKGAEHKKGAKKRTNGDVSLKQGNIKHKKRKAKEAAVASAPALPTEEDIWFDDVDPADIEAAIGPEAARIARRQLGQRESSTTLVKEQAFHGLTRALALDCEMVGVGPKGEESIVARVSLVNQYGKCVYDKYVKPTEPVTDYRTAVSGIRPEKLKQGEELEVVQREVAEMLKGRILVGHALHNDLKVLFLDHPKKKIRDTQKYKPFKSQVKSGRPSLKLLSEKILGIRVQQAEHCSQPKPTGTSRCSRAASPWEPPAPPSQAHASFSDNSTPPQQPDLKWPKPEATKGPSLPQR